ncbi:recombination protein NinB [Klebsiella variicola]|uniref:recombination protein NinB n=1 Tax=Klebsiella variicola TaxID=244366 RepID=UPI002B057210|nr:recombination protein NinB [Klebsiella variicola]
MKQQFCLISDCVKRNFVNFIQSLRVDHRSPLMIETRKESRTDKQNRLMWPLLKDLSDQVIWYGKKLEPAVWKDFILGREGADHYWVISMILDHFMQYQAKSVKHANVPPVAKHNLKQTKTNSQRGPQRES